MSKEDPTGLYMSLWLKSEDLKSTLSVLKKGIKSGSLDSKQGKEQQAKLSKELRDLMQEISVLEGDGNIDFLRVKREQQEYNENKIANIPIVETSEDSVPVQENDTKPVTKEAKDGEEEEEINVFDLDCDPLTTSSKSRGPVKDYSYQLTSGKQKPLDVFTEFVAKHLKTQPSCAYKQDDGSSKGYARCKLTVRFSNGSDSVTVRPDEYCKSEKEAQDLAVVCALFSLAKKEGVLQKPTTHRSLPKPFQGTLSNITYQMTKCKRNK